MPMLYRVIGLMSGSSLDGLDICFAELQHEGGKWGAVIKQAECVPYDDVWAQKLQAAINLPALDYALLHTAYGHWLGKAVNDFVAKHSLDYQVQFIGSHGHTTFHRPDALMTAQVGDGAAIAAETGLPVVSDLRALDVALGGQGAPIVPIGESLLFSDYSIFLNLGGIANISFKTENGFIAYDVCPANRVMNITAAKAGKEYDAGGAMAALGKINEVLLQQLNALDYYAQPYPKSLANDFGVSTVYPLIESAKLSFYDEARTMVAHIVHQLKIAVAGQNIREQKMLVTGGGAFNTFLVAELNNALSEYNIEVVVPDAQIVQYKEALIMGLMAVLRWRQEYNVLPTVTGASRASIGGALWLGGEA